VRLVLGQRVLRHHQVSTFHGSMEPASKKSPATARPRGVGKRGPR
jgi:hypothetical protein